MTDAFLDPHQTDQLGTTWHNLATLVPQLDDLIAGSVMGTATSLGIRIATAPRSRPPINTAAYDHLELIHTAALGWVTNLTDDTTTPWPDGTGPAVLCRHLHINADRIATQPWAPDCLTEATDLHTTAERITNPNHSESITDHRHLAQAELHHRAHQAVGDASDMVAVHHAVTGEAITERAIHQWRRRGKLPDRYGPAGEPWFHYHEIATLAHQARARRRTRT